MRISDWSSDVCSSDLHHRPARRRPGPCPKGADMKGADMTRYLPAIALLLLLSACAEDAPQALGTLEYDRITLPAPVAEKIVSIDVREGQRVAAGERLLTLERDRSQAQVQVAEAERSEEHTSELQSLMRISYAVFCLKKKKQN